MNILINASNLRVGGGLQAADSIIRELHNYPNHRFVVVYPDGLNSTARECQSASNLVFVNYNLPSTSKYIFTGRDKFMDGLLKSHNIEAVLTIFGPSKWRPKVMHLCGFADSHCLLSESPVWKILPLIDWVKLKVTVWILTYLFFRSSDLFYTENRYISNRLKRFFHLKKVYTVTNTYNQVFDIANLRDDSIQLPKFNGVSILTIASDYPHKNIRIIRPLIKYLSTTFPDFKYRFVLTIPEKNFEDLTNIEREHIIFLGPVKNNQCPHLYDQCDFMLLPTLMECFSASYAESMRMKKPIITTNLEFAKSLCGDAALYYEALNYEDLGMKIIKLANDKDLQDVLVDNGIQQLSLFDNYQTRAEKLIKIIESEYNERNII